MPSASPIYGARSFAAPQVLARYLQERSVSVEAQTVHGLEFAMRHLIRWWQSGIRPSIHSRS